MNNTPINLNQALGVPPDPQQLDETINSALVQQVPAFEDESKLPVTNAGRSSLPIFWDLDVSPAQDLGHPGGVNPLFYRNTPPLPAMVLPANFPPGPGLVRMLALRPKCP